MSKNDDKYKVKVKPWWPFIRVNQTDDVFVVPRDKYYIARKSGKRKKEDKE